MESHVIKFKVYNLSAAQIPVFERLLKELPGVMRVDVNEDKSLARVVSKQPLEFTLIRDRLAAHGFQAESLLPAAAPTVVASAVAASTSQVMKFQINGMTCRSCEITVERQFRKVPGVKKVDVDATRGLARIVTEEGVSPKLEELKAAISGTKYTIRGLAPSKRGEAARAELSKRPSFWQLVGLFSLVLILGAIFSKTGLLKPSVGLGNSTSFAAAFLVGLVAASSSCIAVAGGLLLGAAAKFNERHASATRAGKMQPVLLFVAGRLASYGILGGFIGAIGKVLSPSPTVTGALTIAAALVMLIMGLDMLHLAPGWLKRLMPRMPKVLAHRVMNQEGKTHPAAPFLLGAGTFFLPCGFTQALQLYVLTTGSAVVGASILFAFALGTAPALIALGFASGALKGAFGRFFFRFSGALVMVLGLWNFQNGLTITGHPLALPRFSLPERAVAASPGTVDDSFVRFDGQEQVVPIDVSYAGFWPEQFTLRKGVPTKFEVSGDAAGQGCLAVLQIPKLGIRELLKAGATTSIAFTPTNPGNYIFSCSMGMFRGRFTVL